MRVSEPFVGRLYRLIGALTLCLPLLLTACSLRMITDRVDLFDEPTPFPLPTPVGDTLTFIVPQFPVDLGVNEAVPGARLDFVGKQGDLYQLRINGLSAERQAGDSWTWQGVVSPGVLGDYQLALQRSASADRLAANGQVILTILQQSPVETEPSVRNDVPLRFSDIEINYLVPQGATIPGTALRYVGQNDAGQLEFSGTTNYPFYNAGDTLRWRGTLRPNVIITNDLKIVGLDTYGMRVVGSAELLIYPTLNP